MRLQPPNELMSKHSDYEAMIAETILKAESVPSQLLSGVIENVGGRLLLRYDTPDSSSPDFWLFYSSQRLFPMGWAAEKGAPWRLQWPSHLKTHHGTEEWEAVMEMAKEDARRVPLPPDLFENSYYNIPLHTFAVGMKLEAIHPRNMIEICPASIVEVFTPYHFLVKIDNDVTRETDESDSYWLCTATHPYIFPAEVTKTIPAPRTCFPHREMAEELGFGQGMKLEAVNPENENLICAATINKIIDHLLWIHLESNDSFHPNHIVSMDSHDIFPVGWSESNSYPLKPPRYFQMPVKRQEEVDEEPKKVTKVTSVAPQPLPPQQRSFWCPKIYFNHKCFSGPFLSKGKLAQLPKAVGPGPVTLVMKEVLSMLISVAYKSSRVLKELQTDGKPEPGMHLEVLKAKYKNNTYRASVALVTSADEVQSFCKHICTKLQVCPYMFGPVSIGEKNCPENCNTLSKTRFTQYWMHGKRKIGRPKGETSNLIPRPKKKRGRKRLFPKTEVEQEPGRVDAMHDNGQSYSSSQDLTSHSAGSGDNVNGRRKYRRKEFPPTEIKTRGAKLPNFALQMRAGHWTRKQWKASEANHLYSDSKRNVSLQNAKYDRQESPDSVAAAEKESDGHNNNVTGKLLNSHKDDEVIIELNSNPLHWTQEDVYQYLMKTDDCAGLIDGQAFMMLNFPTVRENLYLDFKQALRLCKHIERVKLSFYLNYIVGKYLRFFNYVWNIFFIENQCNLEVNKIEEI
ncbi:Scm-like with four MBT domains protein 2 [Blattella germanica]|nr:Scm-like with four MBT domains protein 2 [Blattella germanica]